MIDPSPPRNPIRAMFDWIFYAIVILPTAFLIWDWFRNR